MAVDENELSIPSYIVDYFLTGRTRPDAVQRFTQNGGIVSDVWFEFAKNLRTPVRVLIAPSEGVSAVDVGAVLHACIREYRATQEARTSKIYPHTRRTLSVSPLENFVAVTLFFDELLRVVLPLTHWWSERHLGRLNQTYNKDGTVLQAMLETEIKVRLGKENLDATKPKRTRGGKTVAPKAGAASEIVVRRIREAAPIVALIGGYLLVERDPESVIEALREKEAEDRFTPWLLKNADEIAAAAVQALAREIPQSVFHPKLSAPSEQAAKANDPDRTDPPPLIDRVFLDRKTGLAVTSGICTIKADAADRVFGISCRNLTWAIIDSGIDARHPAFEDHDPQPRSATRITATLDFTPIEWIRNFALTEHEAGSPERAKAIRDVIATLRHLPDYPELRDPQFEKTATENLERIADQLDKRLQPDWNLIEPLIRRRAPGPGEEEPEKTLVSHHGTHVAGILGADWREQKPKQPEKKVILRGVCPDINLYDLRVIDPTTLENTEFAVLAALEYVQFANRRTAGMKQVIHGVNVSLSIPHEVRSYACGSTPVCVACNNLVGAGVVVVAAAGNRGWNEQDKIFGNFVFCSITDPGNAEDVITVGATHRLKPHTYGVSFFSSRGPTGDGRVKPDLVAPGEKIKGPVLNNADDELDGTSMAAPFVSGAAAMLIARHGELLGNPRRIKKILCESATDLGREKYFQGHGVLDVLRALQSV